MTGLAHEHSIAYHLLGVPRQLKRAMIIGQKRRNLGNSHFAPKIPPTLEMAPPLIE